MGYKIGKVLCTGEGLIRIYKNLPKILTTKPFKEVPIHALSNTVMDPELSNRGGFLPLLPEVIIKSPIEIYPKAGQGLYVPKGINRAFELSTGLAVINPLQRSVDKIVGTMRTLLRVAEQNKVYVWPVHGSYSDAVKKYLSEVMALLFGKAGMIDQCVGSIMPCSGRAVLTNDPQMAPNEVGVPIFMVKSWVRNTKCAELYGISDPDDWDTCRQRLENKRILVGRQPTHDETNLFASVMKIVPGFSIRMNPAVVNLFDGDFDGDTVHVHLPITKQGRASLSVLRIERLLPQAKPGKELRGLELSSNPLFADMDFRTKSREFRTKHFGHSINWYDLIGINEQGTGYFLEHEKKQATLFAIATGEHEKKQATLFAIATGAYRREVPLLMRQGRAMVSYRSLKIGTAKCGGISNIIINLCVAARKLYPDQFNKELLLSAARAKHILCQGQLEHKHGEGSKLAPVESIYDRLYVSGCRANEDILQGDLVELGVPSLDAQRIGSAVMRMWKGNNYSPAPTSNYSDTYKVGSVLSAVNPWYVLTRRQARLTDLISATEDNTGIQAFFMRDDDAQDNGLVCEDKGSSCCPKENKQEVQMPDSES